MNFEIEDILGSGLRILLLGSYDPLTKNILHDLRKRLNERFQRYSCITLMLENLEMYVALSPGSHDYWLFFEKQESSSGYTMIVKEKTKIIDIVRYENEEDFKTRIGFESHNIDFKQFKSTTELEKLNHLNEWADIVYLIRELEATRGGELVELLYLLISQQTNKSFNDPWKYNFFYKEGINISSMVKELIEFFNIVPIDYKDYNDIVEKILHQTNYHISRLNAISNRFNQFENKSL